MMKSQFFKTMMVTLLTTVFSIGFLQGCNGSSSSDSSQSFDEIPVNASVDNLELTAGEPTTLTFTIPKPSDPYTEMTLDIGRTLEEANITVTAR